MFIKIFINYILGYLKIVVEGYYIERFINICTNKKILIWNLKRENGVKLYLNIGINDFKKISEVCRKTKCKVKIESKHGIPFLLQKYKKRKIFLLLLIIVAFCIYFSSNYVWNIEVIEENNQDLPNIMQDLQNAGLSVGTQKRKIDTKEIINSIRLNREDVAWMGIELKGTNAIVKVVKADEAPQIIDDTEYCNIVADKDGIITKINAQNGTAIVNVGDVVKKGTILIAGVMEGKYTEPRYLHAIGEIEAKVWYTKTKKIYYKQTNYEQTGREENNYAIKINNFKINLPKGVSKFELYDTIEQEKKLKIFSNLYLPISIIKTTNKETTKVEQNYSYNEALEVGKKELEQEIENEIKNKENILNKTVNTYKNSEYVEISMTYEVLENIGTNEKIEF